MFSLQAWTLTSAGTATLLLCVMNHADLISLNGTFVDLFTIPFIFLGTFNSKHRMGDSRFSMNSD